MTYRRVLAMIAVALIGVFLAEATADAQRRRRRRAPQPTEQTQPATEEAAADPDAGSGEAASAQATEGEGAPPAQSPPADGRAAGETGEDATPATTGAPPAEAPEEEAPTDFAPLGPDLAPLRAEFTSIMDELVNVRSRMSVLGRQLFRTKVRVLVQNRAGDDNTLARLVVALDGAPVHRGDGSSLGEDAKQVFEGFAAPGPHVLTVEVEQRQRANDDYRYTVRDSFRIQVQRDRRTDVTIILDDDSDMGEDFEDDGEAEYDVSTRVRVETRELGD